MPDSKKFNKEVLQLLFLLLIILFSCKESSLTNQSEYRYITDTVSDINNFRNDFLKDSLLQIKERDSFYSIQPLKVFVSDKDSTAENKLISLLLDRRLVRILENKFDETVDYKYDNNQTPIWKNQVISTQSFKIEIKDSHFNSEKTGQKSLFINNKQQQPGKEMDTSLVWDAFLHSVELDKEYCKLIQVGSKTLLYLRGHVEQCTGLACSVIFHLLYDPVLNKSVVFHQFRIDDFFVGYNHKTGELEFCVMEEGMYNERLDYFPFSGKVYRLNKKGKLLPKKTQDNNNIFFESYKKNGNADSIVLLKFF